MKPLLTVLILVLSGALIYNYFTFDKEYSARQCEVYGKAEDCVTPQVLGASELYQLISKTRKEFGCEKDLRIHKELTKAAQERAEYVSGGNWSHAKFSTTVRKYYNFYYLGETLARDYGTEVEIVNAWMQSPTHKEQLMDCSFQDIGIGIKDKYVAVEYAIPRGGSK